MSGLVHKSWSATGCCAKQVRCRRCCPSRSTTVSGAGRRRWRWGRRSHRRAGSWHAASHRSATYSCRLQKILLIHVFAAQNTGFSGRNSMWLKFTASEDKPHAPTVVFSSSFPVIPCHPRESGEKAGRKRESRDFGFEVDSRFRGNDVISARRVAFKPGACPAEDLEESVLFSANFRAREYPEMRNHAENPVSGNVQAWLCRRDIFYGAGSWPSFPRKRESILVSESRNSSEEDGGMEWAAA